MKNKFLAKLVSAFLGLSLLTSTLGVNALAAEKKYTESSLQDIVYKNNNLNIEILNDNDNERVVKVANDVENDISIAKYNKKTGEVQLKHNNETFNLSESTSKTRVSRSVRSSNEGGYLIDSGNDMDNKYFYAIYTGNPAPFWTVKVPDGSKYVQETSSNRVNLENFRSKVNAYQALQLKIAATSGASALGIIVAQIAAAPSSLGVTAITAILTAAGLGISAVAQGVDLYNLGKDINYYYKRIN